MTSPDFGAGAATTSRAYSYALEIIEKIEESALAMLVDLPTSRYVTTGEPVYDCEQVVVAIVSLQTGLPEGSQSGVPQTIDCGSPWSLVMDVGIVRCGPKVDRNGLIAHTALTEMTEIESVDSDILMDALNEIARESISSVRAAITYGAYEGGFIATTMRLTAALS